jgi:hypothetical protein
VSIKNRHGRNRAAHRSSVNPELRVQREGTPGVRGGTGPDWHRQMVEEAAYYRAERRGFKGGDPLSDWLAAEAEVDALVKGP